MLRIQYGAPKCVTTPSILWYLYRQPTYVHRKLCTFHLCYNDVSLPQSQIAVSKLPLYPESYTEGLGIIYCIALYPDARIVKPARGWQRTRNLQFAQPRRPEDSHMSCLWNQLMNPKSHWKNWQSWMNLNDFYDENFFACRILMVLQWTRFGPRARLDYTPYGETPESWSNTET